MKDVRTAVVENPVTTVAGVGMLVEGVGLLLGWTAEVQGAVAQITLGLAVLARAVVAMFKDA